MIYKDDNLKISIITIGNKKELVIDYFRAGYFLERLVTSDLENPNLVELKLGN